MTALLSLLLFVAGGLCLRGAVGKAMALNVRLIAIGKLVEGGDQFAADSAAVKSWPVISALAVRLLGAAVCFWLSGRVL